MARAMGPLKGERFAGLVELSDLGLRGMITVRGDLASPQMARAVKDAAGVDLPDRRRASFDGDRGCLWMSPDELLVVVPYDGAEAAVAALGAALAGTHHLVADVSDARAVIGLSGEDGAVREVLAKLSPADLRPESLAPGEVRRTRLAQVPAAFWFTGEGRAEVVCFRSVARYVFDILKVSAAPGSAVGHF